MPNTAPSLAATTLGTFSCGYDPETHAVHLTVPLADGADADAVRDAIGAAVQKALGATWDRSNHLVVDVSKAPPHVGVLIHAHAHRREQHAAIEHERTVLRRVVDAMRSSAGADLRALLDDADTAMTKAPPLA